MSTEVMKLALDALLKEQRIYTHFAEGVPAYVADAITALRQAIAQPAQQTWIPVSERMPEPHEVVLTLRDNRIGIDHWWGPDYVFTPKYWMPLPAAPEVK